MKRCGGVRLSHSPHELAFPLHDYDLYVADNKPQSTEPLSLHQEFRNTTNAAAEIEQSAPAFETSLIPGKAAIPRASYPALEGASLRNHPPN